MPAYVLDASAKTNRYYSGGIGYQSDATRSGTLVETDFVGNITLTIAIPLLVDGLVFTGNTAPLLGGVTGGKGADTLTGLAGNDLFFAGTGINVLDGGDGIDEVSLDFSDQASSVNFFNGGVPGVVYQITAGGKNVGSIRNIEIVNVRTGAGNDVVGTALISQDGTLYGGTFDGGAGTDNFVFNASAADPSLAFSNGEGGNPFAFGFPNYSITNFERLVFTGRAAYIMGGSFADTLTGSDQNDLFDGGAGGDAISGGAGDDVLLGGRGNNLIDGGTGTDVAGFDFSDQKGNVVLVNGGVAGTTYQVTSGGAAFGSVRNVEVTGSIKGGAGNDRIGGVYAAETGATYSIVGGAGTDTFIFDASALTQTRFVGSLLASLPFIASTMNSLGVSLAADVEAIEFTGNANGGQYRFGYGYGGDIPTYGYGYGYDFSGGGLQAGAGADKLTGLDGNDVFHGGRGANVIDGGGGMDVAGFDFSDQTGDVVLVNGGVPGTTYQITSGGSAYGSVRNIEVTGSIAGGAGNDRIGGVYAVATGQTYSITGGAGTDTFVFDASGMAGERFSGKVGGALTGLNGDMTVGMATDVEVLEFTGNANDGPSGNGIGYDGTFWGGRTGYGWGAGVTGGAGADRLTGLDGNDVFFGGGGADVIDGGGGFDRATLDYRGQTADVVLVNGAAPGVTYQATLGGKAFGSVRNVEVLSFLSGEGNDRVGGAYIPVMTGTFGFDGGAGEDTFVIDLSGLAGTPYEQFTYFVDNGTLYDQFYKPVASWYSVEALEFTGNAYPSASSFDWRGVVGGTGNDILIGLGGDDVFHGGRGANVIDGGDGIDTAGFDFSDQSGDVVLVNGGVAGVTYEATVGGVPHGSVRNVEITGNITGGFGDDRIGGVYIVAPQRRPMTYTVSGGADGTDTFVFDASGDTEAKYTAVGGPTFTPDGRPTSLWEETSNTYISLKDIEALEFTGNANSSFPFYNYGVHGGIGNDKLTGLDGDDIFTGYWGDDILTGNGGNDRLDGGRGANVIDGGEGTDTGGFDFSDQEGDVVLVNGGVAGVTYQATVGGTPFGSVRNVEVTGSIAGGWGNDRIGGIYNWLPGTRAGYSVSGGEGADTFVFDASANTGASFGPFDRWGQDAVPLSLFDATSESYVLISPDVEAIEFTGNATAGSSAGGVHGGIGRDKLTGLSGNDTFTGNTGDDILTGNGGNDRLDGGRGANVIDGGEGTDTGGFDFSDQEGDVVLVNGGVAGVTYQATVDGALFGSVRNVEVTGSIAGGGGNDRIGGVYNWLAGTTREYSVSGGGGDDTFVFDASANTGASFGPFDRWGQDAVPLSLFDATSESYVLISLDVEAIEFTGNATAGSSAGGVHGGTGADKLTGLSGNDTFTGNTGDDVLTGNGGDDRLSGGDGVDIAVFNGSRAGYAITAPEPGLVRVSGADGVDTLDTVEFALFIEDERGTFGGTPWRQVAVDGATVTRAEGQVGTTSYLFTVLNIGDTTQTQTLYWSVKAAPGEGIAGASAADFAGGAFPSGSITFAPGEPVKTISVGVQGDGTQEGDERFAIGLATSAAGAVTAPVFAQGIIADDEGEISIAALVAVQDEGQAGTTAFSFTVTRASGLAGVHSASYAVTGSGGSPANAADFAGGVLPSGIVSFAPGQTSRTVTIPVAGDAAVEAAEGFTVTLSAPSVGTTIGTATATGTILNDDAALSIAAEDANRVEGSFGTSGFAFRVTRSGDTSRVQSVSYAVTGAGGSPATAADFAGVTSGVVGFAVGETSRILLVSVAGDTVVEANEDFTVTLFAPSAGATVATATATGTIVNDDASLSIAALAASRGEGQSGTTPFSFLVTRTGVTSKAHTVAYAATGSGGSPAISSDFAGGVLPSGLVSFAVGETSRTVTVNVAGDTEVEPAEGFTVTLSGPSSGATIGTATAVGSIANDDASLSILPLAASRAEGQSGTTPFTFTVARTGDTSVSHTVGYAVFGSGGSPASGSDFAGGVLPSGTVSFAAGEATRTVTVNVAGDTVVEPAEGFSVVLSSPSSGATIGTASAVGSIANDDASLSIAALAASRAEGQSGTTLFTFTVTRAGDSATAHTVAYAVTGSGGNPASAADFAGGVLPSGVVSFAAGESSRTITLNVVGDAAVEADEAFTVTLSTPSTGATIATASASGSIVNDDSALSIAALAASRAEGTGGTTAFTFTVTRTGDTTVAHTVGYAVTGSGGNPANAADFAGGVLPSGVVSFAPGETSRTVTLNVAADSAVEADEGFTVALSGPSTGATIATAAATGSILNDDAALSIAALAASRAEGTGGTTAFTFTVTRTGDTTVAHTVGYAATGSGGNPAGAADFAGGLLPSGVVSFAPGATSRTVTLNVAADSAVEADEGFTVTLSTPSTGATIATASATGSIVNDDAALSIAALAASRAEGTGGTTAFTFTMTRTGDTTVAHTVGYAVTGSGGNPAGAADFAGGVLPSGVVSFAPGETSRTVTLNVAADSAVEADEGFTVTLSGPSTGATIATASATGSILNDDAALSIAALAADAVEGTGGTRSLTFTVARDGDTTRPQVVDYSVAGSGSNPADAADFVGGMLPSGSVSFAVGDATASIAIAVAGDRTHEADETFQVTLANPTDGATLATSVATGTIRNDDLAATGTVSVARLQASRGEGQAGIAPFTFLATRSGDTSGPAWAQWTVTGGSVAGTVAANAADFAGGVLPSGEVVFAPGEAARIVTIEIASDTAAELNESFQLGLSGVPAGVHLGAAGATGIIWNDDAPGTGSLSIRGLAAQQTEGLSRMKAFTFIVTRSGDVSGPASADWTVSSGGVAGTFAANGADFVGGILPSGRVSFAPGRNSATIAVNVAGDAAMEANDSFTVMLSGPQAGVSIGRAAATGVILDDDTGRSWGLPQAAGTAADLFLLGQGMNAVLGHGGIDLFRFLPAALGAAAANATTLQDFSPVAGEVIDLSPIAATPADDPFSFIGTAAFSGAGQLRWQDQGGARLIQGEVNGDGIADLTILVMAAGPVESNWFAL